VSNRWIIGKDFNVKILREFSLYDLIGEIYPNTGQNAPPKPLSPDEVRKLKVVQIGGVPYAVRWTRMESDDRGSYMAVALMRPMQ
jgi:hypothetical protein